jgi:hypothetical protein
VRRGRSGSPRRPAGTVVRPRGRNGRIGARGHGRVRIPAQGEGAGPRPCRHARTPVRGARGQGTERPSPGRGIIGPPERSLPGPGRSPVPAGTGGTGGIGRGACPGSRRDAGYRAAHSRLRASVPITRSQQGSQEARLCCGAGIRLPSRTDVPVFRPGGNRPGVGRSAMAGVVPPPRRRAVTGHRRPVGPGRSGDTGGPAGPFGRAPPRTTAPAEPRTEPWAAPRRAIGSKRSSLPRHRPSGEKGASASRKSSKSTCTVRARSSGRAASGHTSRCRVGLAGATTACTAGRRGESDKAATNHEPRAGAPPRTEPPSPPPRPRAGSRAAGLRPAPPAGLRGNRSRVGLRPPGRSGEKRLGAVFSGPSRWAFGAAGAGVFDTVAARIVVQSAALHAGLLAGTLEIPGED